MPGCDRCGGDGSLAYSCNYCSGSFCSSHRLPENHNCIGLRGATSHESDSRDTGGDRGVEASVPPGYDPSKEPPEKSVDYESSPDVAADGSLVQNEEGESSNGDGESPVKKTAWTLFGVGVLVAMAPIRILQSLPEYIYAANRWLGQLLGSIYALVRTAAPAVIVLLALVFAAGLVGTGVPPIDDASQKGADAVGGFLDADRSDEEHAIEQAIHQEANEVRSERGLNRMAFDHSLANVARNHSRDMADRDFFSHQNPDGEGSRERLRGSGVRCQVVGENLFRSEGYGTTPNRTAERVVESWLESPAHRENLLRKGWRKEGIGVYLEGDEMWVTQVFCG